MRNGICMLLFGVVFVCASAQAQQPMPHYEAFVEGGITWNNAAFSDTVIVFGNPPLNQTLASRDTTDTRGRLFVGFRYWFNGGNAVEASYAYVPTTIFEKDACEVVNCGVGLTETRTHLHYFSLNYVKSFRAEKRLRPYFTSGVGWVYTHGFAIREEPITGIFGAGIDVGLSSHWAFRAEYRDIMADAPRSSDFRPSGLVHNSSPSIGLAYRF